MRRNTSEVFIAAGFTVAIVGVSASGIALADNGGSGGPATNRGFTLGSDNAGSSLQPIEVIGVTPLLGSGIDKDKFPANVQTISGADFDDSHSTSLPTFLNDRLGSVFVNDAVDNPLQPNVTIRGYTISPLLGKPQGLAVYQDGVRINEPFGDTVNFALVPEVAISSVQLTPGSDPVFGRNALGGALSIQTKSGRTDPGSGVQFSAGSFGRRSYQAYTGGVAGQLDYFVSGSYFNEDGWRDFSPSRDGRIFGKLGWQNDDSRLALSYTHAETNLIGNGGTPVELLERNRSAIFTRPDQTKNNLNLVNLQGNHSFTNDLGLAGNVYYRDSDDNTRNGDDSDFEECEPPNNSAFLCDDDDDYVLDSNGNQINATSNVVGGTNNTTSTNQDGYGGSLQLTLANEIAGTQNHLVVGAAYDEADIDYAARTELASLDSTRRAVGGGVFDGSSFVDAGIKTRSYGIYFSDTWTPIDPLSFTVSGRYNRNKTKITDRIGTALNGNHTFDHFNPAVGATYRLMPDLSVYARYSVSNRFPVASELTCADPNAPCRLPNDFLADPPLKQVVSKSEEIGLRGKALSANYTLAFFNSVNHDDIQFISSGALQNTGYFKNVGKTRRQGIELTLDGQIKRLDWFLNYTFLNAEFRDSFTASNPNNPAADSGGEVQVKPGDRLPSIPRNLFKLGGNFHVTDNLDIGGTLLYRSHAFFAGDPTNESSPVAGYGVVNLNTNYRVTENVSFFARLDNVFDHDYSTFGTFGEADEVLGDDFDNPRFLSPAPPRAVFVGTQVRF